MTSQRQLPLGDLSEVPYFSLDLHARPEQDVVEVLLTGDLDEATVGHLEDGLAWVIEHLHERRVVVDLSGTRRVEACGLSALRRTADALRGTGRHLDVRQGTGATRLALEAAGLRVVASESEG